MKAIVNGKVLTEQGFREDCCVSFEGSIAEVGAAVPAGAEVIDAQGGFVVPGLIDVHIHGYLGCDCSDGDPEGIRTIAKGLVSNGVTSFLPTTMTLPYPVLEQAFDAIRRCMRSPGPGEASILGINAEGPYLSYEKRGAHQADQLRPPESGFLLKHSDVVRLTTIAPELPGAEETIRDLTEGGIRVALGHTAADLETARRGIDAGATEVTHMFNAMPSLHHRKPGAGAAFLADDRVWAELIADGFHVDPVWFPILARVKRDRLILITDCTRAGGMGDGEYELGGQSMTVSGIRCLLKDGTIAGSILTLDRAIGNMIEKGGAEPAEAFRMATLAPAEALGLKDRGRISPGLRSDLAVFGRDLRPRCVWIGGRRAL